MSAELISELKQLIINTLNLEDVSPGDIDDNEPLIGGGLDLDSIDALELVLKLEKTYGIKVDSSEKSREILGSVSKLADYISAQRNHV